MNAMPISISRSSDILLLKPRKQKLPYVREEEKGYYSVLTNNGDMNYTMLNHIAMEIYSLVMDKLP